MITFSIPASGGNREKIVFIDSFLYPAYDRIERLINNLNYIIIDSFLYPAGGGIEKVINKLIPSLSTPSARIEKVINRFNLYVYNHSRDCRHVGKSK